MYLNKILVKNFKAITDMELEFTPGVNLLIGDNGVGKSSLLEAIVIAMSGMFKGLAVFLQKELCRTIFISKRPEEVMPQQKYLMGCQRKSLHLLIKNFI